MKTALTIAGSDCSGGAGIQADIKTMTMNGVYAMSVITALTAQNTCGVFGVQETSPDFLAMQLDAVFSDIRPDAIKIGMTSSSALIRVIADKLAFNKADNIVIDPVMISTSGRALLHQDAIEILKSELFPLASVITPNLPEASALTGITIETDDDMLTAAKLLYDAYGCAVLVKGGHRAGSADDLLFSDGSSHLFPGKRIDNPNNHGTGCTLSSAIAANLAKGYDLVTSVERAKQYITAALSAMLDLGNGCGPMNHAFDLAGTFSA